MSVHTPSKPLPSHPRHLTWLPTSRMGRWALACAVLAPLVLLVPNLIWGPGPDHPIAVAGSAAGFALAIAAPILTTIAAIRRRERSIVLIVASAFLALVVVAFFFGELFMEGR